jgi:hypothetical protein
MMISGVSSNGPVNFGQPVSRPTAQPVKDQMSMSLSADTFSSLISEVGQMPDVRGEVVDAYKSRVQSGEYPSPQTLDGLSDLIGDHWSQFAAASSSDTSTSG